MHSVEEFAVLSGSGTGLVGWDGVGGLTITDSLQRIGRLGTTHVLDDNVAVQLGVESTTVLVGPFDGEKGTLIVRHGGSMAVPSLRVVLGVHQPVAIVPVGIGLIETTIGTSWVHHVEISIDMGYK